MEVSEIIIECPNCRSRMVKKNGHLSNGKQNYRCKPCGRQFVSNSLEWHVTGSDIALVDKLLLEKISLQGICRVVGISQSWLLTYLKEVYPDLPDDLNADLFLPDIDSWLFERMDEEIGQLEVVKKIRMSWTATKMSKK